jgi:hypothetical protein
MQAFIIVMRLARPWRKFCTTQKNAKDTMLLFLKPYLMLTENNFSIDKKNDSLEC